MFQVERHRQNCDSPTNTIQCHYLYQIFRFAVCLFSLFCLDVMSNCSGGDSSCSAWGKPSESSKSFMSLARAQDLIPTYQTMPIQSHSFTVAKFPCHGSRSLQNQIWSFSESTLKHIKTLQRKRSRTKVSQGRLELIKGELSRTIVVHLVTASHSSDSVLSHVAHVARERILPSPWSLSPSLAKLQYPSSATPAFQTSIFPNSFFKTSLWSKLKKCRMLMNLLQLWSADLVTCDTGIQWEYRLPLWGEVQLLLVTYTYRFRTTARSTDSEHRFVLHESALG